MYKPGTLITLKDGNVYRTSKKVSQPCNKCMNFYNSYHKTVPCTQTSRIYSKPPFGHKFPRINKLICARLFGICQFPKLVLFDKLIIPNKYVEE